MSNLPASHFLPSEPLEREAHRRGDSEWLRQQFSGSPQFIFVWRGCNLFGVGENKRPFALRCLNRRKCSIRFFSASASKAAALFAADLSALPSEEEALAFLNLSTDLARFIPLRQFDGLLSSEERSLLFYSRVDDALASGAEILSIDAAIQLCPEEAGHIMGCTNPECATKHFPRTDPATIMLVHCR